VAKKAEQSSLDTLSGRVSSTENGITAANSSITSLNAAIRAENASSGDLITNPTFDPQYAQMGFTVVKPQMVFQQTVHSDMRLNLRPVTIIRTSTLSLQHWAMCLRFRCWWRAALGMLTFNLYLAQQTAQLVG
jgi:hypothetical protein